MLADQVAVGDQLPHGPRDGLLALGVAGGESFDVLADVLGMGQKVGEQTACGEGQPPIPETGVRQDREIGRVLATMNSHADVFSVCHVPGVLAHPPGLLLLRHEE
ncbi:hypothetical protein GCM10018952_21930 [Streptosporangium vulgare]